MDVKTKYNIRDEVWAMYENMAVSASVTDIHIEEYETKWCGLRTECYYKIKSPHVTKEIHESRLFPTKEELLKSL